MPIIRLDNFQPFQAINILSDPGAIGGPKVIPQCAQVRIRFTLTDGKTGYIVMAGRYAGAFAVTPTMVTTAHASLTSGATWTALAAHLAPTVSLSSLDVRDLAVAGQPLIGSTGPAVPGTSSGTALPDEVALCITLRTAKAGPAARGRMYFPGWATTALGTGGAPAAAAVTALNNWANSNLTTAFTNLSLTQCLALPARAAYEGATGTQHPARAASTLDLTGKAAEGTSWDSQRRRGKK